MGIEGKLKKTMTTGHVVLGFIGTKKAMGKGDVKLVVVSQDCPYKNEIMDLVGETPVHMFPGKGFELGAACGKPFAVSVLSVLDEGKSDILEDI
jgi:large subunit ribosomal protein L30e